MGLYEYVQSTPAGAADPSGQYVPVGGRDMLLRPGDSFESILLPYVPGMSQLIEIPLVFHVVESDEGTSTQGEQYVEPPDARTKKPVMGPYRDAVRGVLGALEEMTDDEFDEAKKAGKVKFDGKPFEGNRKQYIEKVRRELESSWVQQRRGGPEAFKKKVEELKKRNTEPYDSTGVGVHGGRNESTHQPHDYVTINGIKVPREKYLGELKEGHKVKGGFVLGSCYEQGDEMERLDFKGGGQVIVDEEGKVEDITFTPGRVIQSTQRQSQDRR